MTDRIPPAPARTPIRGDAPSRTPIAAATHAFAGKRVMVVDDNEDNRLLLDRDLRAGGYRTLLAEGGREALSLLRRRGCDLVLLDWMMPDLSGLDTLRAIRETYAKAQLPVIMCTAMGEEMSVVTAINAGASDYMTKPINTPILRARIMAQFEQQAALSAAIAAHGRPLVDRTTRR